LGHQQQQAAVAHGQGTQPTQQQRQQWAVGEVAGCWGPPRRWGWCSTAPTASLWVARCTTGAQGAGVNWCDLRLGSQRRACAGPSDQTLMSVG
jgi:hypothetical protein